MYNIIKTARARARTRASGFRPKETTADIVGADNILTAKS